MYTINLENIICNSEVNEGSAAEEPYVLVTSVKLDPPAFDIALGTFEVYLYGPWVDTDKGETKPNSQPPFWGRSAPEDIPSDDTTIFIISLMENDNGNPSTYRVLAKAAAATSLASTLHGERDDRAETLRVDIRDALKSIDGVPLDMDDDHVASVQLRVRRSDLPTSRIPIRRSLEIRNQEGNYTLNFIIRNHSTAYLSGLPCTGNPVMIQSNFGSVGNFELITPLANGGLASYYRENDLPETPWRGPSSFGAGRVEAATMIQSTSGPHGDLEVVARVGDRLQLFRRDSGPTYAWSGPVPLLVDSVEVTGVSGNPVLIQGRFGAPRRGNLELVVPLAGGGIAHYSRDNTSLPLRWRRLPSFGSGLRFDALTMIQSHYGTPGNLEVVARWGGRLMIFWRDSGPGFRWNGPEPLVVDGAAVTGVSGNAVLIQNHFGVVAKENFELAVPLRGGGIAQFVRENAKPDTPWRRLPIIAPGLRAAAITMIQRRFTPGNLELVARVDAGLVDFSSSPGPPYVWDRPDEL